MDASTGFSETTFCIATNSPAEQSSPAPDMGGAHALRRELNLLRQRLDPAPLALAAFASPETAGNGPCPRLGSAIRACMLSCDSLGLLETGHYALILPGAGMFKAQALVEEILKAEPGLAHAVGIAVDNGEAQPENLLERATHALHDALRSGEAVRAYRDAEYLSRERETLVHSDEKRFLFHGGE